MSDVIIFGTGQIAEVAKSYLDWEGTHKVVAYTVNAEYLTDSTKDGLPVAQWESIEEDYPNNQVRLFCPLSYKQVNNLRKKIYQEGLDKGYEYISFIHPDSYYYGTPVGQNCFIMEANVIQPHVSIGNNCILWSGNHIGHHSRIDDHTFIASHVVVSGNVIVGERCFLGVNCTIRDNIKIGSGCVIGAGALVTNDLDSDSVIPGEKSRISRLKSYQLKGI